jgi:hypothetical protein
MGRPINSDSTVTRLWSPIALKKPEDGGDVFSETLGLTRATRSNTPQDIYNFYRRENIPEDSVLTPYILSLYGEANQQ